MRAAPPLTGARAGPADKAGMRGTTRDETGRLQLGDVITAVDGVKVKSSGDLYRTLDKHRVGDTLRVRVERLAAPAQTLEVTLEEKDDLPKLPARLLAPLGDDRY